MYEEKKRYSNQDISDYYEQTEIHYRRAWDLDASKALHYGYWDSQVSNFRESLQRMNEVFAAFADIQPGQHILDAGCGVGGSSIYLAKTLGCKVTGVTLSQKQVEMARKNAEESGVSHLVDFYVQDFTRTSFPDQTFDVIWGMESVVYIHQKIKFMSEAFRILKPGGKIVLAEYLQPERELSKSESRILNNWLNAWAIETLNNKTEVDLSAKEAGFSVTEFKNVTPNIRKASWRMYYGSFYLRLLSGLYRLYNPKVRHFADNHYQSLYYQYPALKKGLWNYYFIKCQK